MSKILGRIITVWTMGAILLGAGAERATAGLTLTCTPSAATANSVRNFSAVFTNSKGIWPLGRPTDRPGGTVTEGHVDYGGLTFPGNPTDRDPLPRWYPGQTIGRVRPDQAQTAEETEYYWIPWFLPPEGFVGFSQPTPSGPGEVFQPLGYLSVQPDPGSKVRSERSGDERYDTGLNYWPLTDPSNQLTVPDGTGPVENVEVSPARDGTLIPKVIYQQDAISDDPDTTDVNEARPQTPCVIVPKYSPVWLVGVWTRKNRTNPLKAHLEWANRLYPRDPDIPGSGWPAVRVIVLDDGCPDPGICEDGKLYIEYYGPGTHYVVTQQSPLPLPYTVYRLNTTPNTNRVKFNPRILTFDVDTNKNDPTSWDVGLLGRPRAGDAQQGVPGNPLLGIYDTAELETAAEAVNYAQYFGTMRDSVAGNQTKLLIYLTTALPAGAYDPDPDGVQPYTGDKVWVRFVQRAIVTAPGNRATLENPAIVGAVWGVNVSQNLDGRDVYAGGFTPGSTTVNIVRDSVPVGTAVWVDCRVQFHMTPTGHNDRIISGTPFSQIFADAGDNSFAMYKILGVFLNEAATGTNYFVPYEPPSDIHPAYAVWNLPLGKKTGAVWPTFYFKISTYAVEKVTTDLEGATANLCNPANGGAYDGKLGLIRLNRTGATLPPPAIEESGAMVRGRSVYVWYNPLSRTSITPGVPGASTLMDPDASRGVVGLEPWHDPGGPNPDFAFSPSMLLSWGSDRFVLKSTNPLPAGTTSARMDICLGEPDAPGRGVVWLHLLVDGTRVPMYYCEGDPLVGAVYKVAASAGLNMSNPLQQPSSDWLDNLRENNNRLIYDPMGRPMHYLPGLISNADGTPAGRGLKAYVCYVDSGQLACEEAETTVTVHDSTPGGGYGRVNYGGQSGNRDWLTCYPDTYGGGSWPQGYDVDPLQVEPIEHSNPTFPDDGSSSTQFVFRVRYNNQDGLPPLPWMEASDDPWAGFASDESPSGVVLYLDEKGTGDYRPHFMKLERPDIKPGDPDYENYRNLYVYRIIPHHQLGYRGDPLYPPFQYGRSDYQGTYYDNYTYQSLACGVYQYFFACSDDSLRFLGYPQGDSFVFKNQTAAGRLEWGENSSWLTRNSTGLDPSLARAVTGYPEMNRAAKRRYSADGGATPRDNTIYVDREVRVPGFFEGGFSYPWKSSTHPRVTCELRMPVVDSQGVRYDDQKYGFGRFFGTIEPFYRASNPAHPGTRTGGGLASLAETCGVTTATELTFRIMWKQIDNKPPIYIRVYINNASERTGTTPGHQYTAYTMEPAPNQTQPYNYRAGVWYQYKTKLPPGPHTYYFQAYDGEHVVRWPVRPDRYPYDLPGQPGSVSDWWTPTESLPTQRGSAGYVDNDYVSGPYVNNPCVLSEATVTPGTGKEGQRFRYRIKYADPDGQRVYNAFIYIKINDRGDVRKLSMLQENPWLDPESDHSQDYKNGVYYYLDTATIRDLSLEPGVRQYYFEFTDDWGRQGDINDTVQGETTRFPAAPGSWIDGPVISHNIPPTLSNGSVESQDGTANSATLWTCRVTYRDRNNDAPTLIKVYIGLLQPDGRSILWDDGHAMVPDDPSDTVYADGKSYYYQTRLGGTESIDPTQPKPEPKQYYYAFVAFDGNDWATYKSSAKDEERSNAAGCMVMHDLVSAGDGIHYTIVPLLAQRATCVTPPGGGNVVDIIPDDPGSIIRVVGVYRTENLSADATYPQTYYNPALDTKVFKNGDTAINLARTVPNGTAVKIRYVATDRAIRTQDGVVAGGTTALPADPADIARVISVKLADGSTTTNYYSPFESIRLNVAALPAGTKTAWIEYEAQSPIVGPLPIELPAPAGVIADATIWEDYTSYPDPVPIDDQKNGWVPPTDDDEKVVVAMTGQCVYETQPSSRYVAPDDSSSIASVEGVYNMADLSGLNYVQTQIWKVDPSDPTRKTVQRAWDPLVARVQRIYGVYTDPEMLGTNYYNPGGLNGFKVDTLQPFRSTTEPTYTVLPPNPSAVESIVGIYGTRPANYAAALALGEDNNYYAFDHISVQQTTSNLMVKVPGRRAVKPAIPDLVKQVTGVYVDQDLSGTNFYDANYGGYVSGDVYIAITTQFPADISNAWVTYVDIDDANQVALWPVVSVVIKDVLGIYLNPNLAGTNYYDPASGSFQTEDPYIVPTTRFPQGTTSAWVSFINLGDFANPDDDFVDLVRWPVVTPVVTVPEREPVKQIIGVYDNAALSGKNYYDPTKVVTFYQHGDRQVRLTEDMPGSVSEVYIRYENLGFGFGPDMNRIALKRGRTVSVEGPLYLAYFTGGKPDIKYVAGQPTEARLTLSTALPAGVSKVYIHVSADTFNCGDTVVRLVEDLLSTDPQGEVIAPLVVRPSVLSAIGGVKGVYRSQSDAENDLNNMYAGTEAPFKLGDTTIRLKSSLQNPPAVGTKNIYIVYIPKKAYISYSDIRYTHQVRGFSEQPSGAYYYTSGSAHFTPDGSSSVYLDRATAPIPYQPHLNVRIKSNLEDRAKGMDRYSNAVSGGFVGVWMDSTRSGINFFDPKKSNRYSIDPLHLKLTTQTPLGTGRLWARCYQKGEYHIDRWNRQVKFLWPRSGRIQASYFFGSRMPQTIGENTPPELLAGSGKVKPLYGSRVTQFVYTVTYRDLDGPGGQAPAYVRVYIDGRPYDMTPDYTGGTPPYRDGAVFTFTLPGGLSGGSHKYHFEASDGLGVAWYDANGPHQSWLGAISESIVDIDGPWVNDPPLLSDGQANPNPPTGINPWDSVDYTVVYTDADNDAPFFYDPIRDTSTLDSNNNGIRDVIEYSGSPRVWIDSGVVDRSYFGMVAALEADPMDLGKKRIIVADGSPGWAPDQFAGKLMQITNGALAGRVYLIQSNTANKLVIATNDLATDGVIAGGAKASQFVINGLLMSKADPTQQDFTKGVRYKITVPKLSVGDHSFHFTARSRETKPQWLLPLLPEEEKTTFSMLVREPATMDANGPKVISRPPEGNTAPTIFNTLATSLYLGPRDQMAAVVSSTELSAYDASLWAELHEVRGVCVNANDFDLNTVFTEEEQAKSYYDPRTASPVFRPGDNRIVLTSALPANPPTSMVSFGAVVGDLLLEVSPDRPGTVGTVTGVYLVSDPTLAGTNYFLSADGTESGTFDGLKITLKQALPSGTKRVYVAYELKAGVTWTNVPVYVKYFAQRTAGSFKASDLVTFRINYRDPNNDPPNYHDNVQGFVKVVFNDISLSYQMRLLNPPLSGQTIDYTQDVAFTSQPVTLPEGTHKYHFEASDGYYVVRYPTGILGDPTANDYPAQVNYRPVIVSASVQPATGQPASEFTFTARYRDQDGVYTPSPPPPAPKVAMRISRVDVPGLQLYKELTPPAGTKNYPAGVDFTTKLIPAWSSPVLPSGIYKVVFEATDSDGEDAAPYPPATQQEIRFTVRETNTAPVIVSGSVRNTATGRSAGKLNDYFIYGCRYSDADGDSPLGKYDGTRDTLYVFIDKGTANEIRLTLTKAASAPANPTPADYIAGVDYETSAPISGKRLGAGRHTYQFEASDGSADAVPLTGQGPLLLIPHFENFRLVSASETNPSTAPAMTSAVVGDQALIVGDLTFPQTDEVGTVPPAAVENITLTIYKPDGTQLTLEASAAVRNWTGPLTVHYSKAQAVDPAFATGKSLTFTASGNWRVGASWPGNQTWDKATTEGRDAALSVTGPMRTIAVANPDDPEKSTPLVDMITPPRIIGSPDVGRIFGYEKALGMRIVRWDTAVGAYFRYGGQSQFPSLNPGEAIWIKPNTTYPADSITITQVQSGLLSLGNPEVAPDYLKKYRLINTFVSDYKRDSTTGKLELCVTQLRAGWNQVGNIFFNWKKNAAGVEIVPKEDVGIPVAEVKVKYLNETKTLAQAAAAGWVRDYMWRYDAPQNKYVLVSATAGGAERVLKAWSGYWIKAFVDCQLIIDPNTTYNGASLSAATNTREVAVQREFEEPPPVPE